MARYRSKPTEVEAFQFLGLGIELAGWAHEHGGCIEAVNHETVRVRTIQGQYVTVRSGEWLVCEPEPGRYYPVADEVFRRKYEPVPDVNLGPARSAHGTQGV